MLGKLFAGAKALATGKNAIDAFNNADDVNAFLAGMACVAGADGEIEPGERKAITDAILGMSIFESYDRMDLQKKLDKYYGWALTDLGKENLFDVIRKVPDGSDRAAAIVRRCVVVAKGDGEFEPEEKVVIKQICEVLAVDYNKYPELRG